MSNILRIKKEFCHRGPYSILSYYFSVNPEITFDITFTFSICTYIFLLLYYIRRFVDQPLEGVLDYLVQLLCASTN